MMRKILIVLLILLAFAIPAGADPVENLTNRSGPTYIEWTWDYNTTDNADLYVDGVFIENTKLEYYVMSDLRSREYHTISLINNTTGSVYVTQTTQTFYPAGLFYIIILLTIVLFVFGIFLRDALLAVLFESLAFVASLLGFSLSFGYEYIALTYLMVIFMALSALWAISAVISILLELKDREQF